MNTTVKITVLALIATSLWAADFQNGQAARAVMGQSSFSTRAVGIAPTALTISNGNLYAADVSNRLLTFDLGQIPGPHDDLAGRQGSACVLCGFPAVASVSQSVIPGSAAIAVFGNTIVIADAANGRVLIWRDASLPSAAKGPDLVLGASTAAGASLSASTIVNPISVAFDGKRLFVGDAALHRILVWNALPAAENQPADAVLGQQNFTSVTVTDAVGPDSISRPSALVSDGTNLFVADALDHRILVFTAADTPLPNYAVANSASLAAGSVAPGTLVTITGDGLSETSEAVPDESSEALPNKLAGVEVFLNGVILPVLSASPKQVRAQVSYDLGDTSAASLYIRTQHGDGSVTISNATTVKMLPATPGVFGFGGDEPRIGMILHTDASSGQPGAPVTAENPARPGEILVLWAAGLGAIDSGDSSSGVVAGAPYDGPDAPVLTAVDAVVSGRSAQVISATLPHGSIGIYEVRVQLPADLPADPKTALLLTQNSYVSNTVTIPVQTTVQ